MKFGLRRRKRKRKDEELEALIGADAPEQGEAEPEPIAPEASDALTAGEEAGGEKPSGRRLRLPRLRRRRRRGKRGEEAGEAPEDAKAEAEASEAVATEPGPAEEGEDEPIEQVTAAADAGEAVVVAPPNSVAVRDAGTVLLDALAEHVPGAREHADATATYSFATAVELGVPRQQSELIREVARLHEIGKVYVPSVIASHPRSELLPGERRELDAHHEQGRSLAVGAGLGEEVGGWILAARERYDGRGPEGLAGRAIPLAARIIRAACSYHEGTRLRRAARWRGEPREAGLARIRAASGDELDPEVVEALSRVLGRAASRAGGGQR